MGPAAPPLPTLPNGCFHRWQEQEELREAQALSRSVAVTPLRPPKACVGRWCSSHSGSPGSGSFLGTVNGFLFDLGTLCCASAGSTACAAPWQSPHDSFFCGPLFLVVPALQLLVFIHSEHLHPHTHPLSHMPDLHSPPLASHGRCATSTSLSVSLPSPTHPIYLGHPLRGTHAHCLRVEPSA